MLKWVVHAEQVQLQEGAVCFGGQLMRGNRAQKVNASNYQAFDSPTYHKLALLGVEVDWQAPYLLQVLLAMGLSVCLGLRERLVGGWSCDHCYIVCYTLLPSSTAELLMPRNTSQCCVSQVCKCMQASRSCLYLHPQCHTTGGLRFMLCQVLLPWQV